MACTLDICIFQQNDTCILAEMGAEPQLPCSRFTPLELGGIFTPEYLEGLKLAQRQAQMRGKQLFAAGPGAKHPALQLYRGPLRQGAVEGIGPGPSGGRTKQARK